MDILLVSSIPGLMVILIPLILRKRAASRRKQMDEQQTRILMRALHRGFEPASEMQREFKIRPHRRLDEGMARKYFS